MYKVDCTKCSGSGYIRAFSHIHGGTCFSCGGKGYHYLKNKPRSTYKYAFSAICIETGERLRVFARNFKSPNVDKARLYFYNKVNPEVYDIESIAVYSPVDYDCPED